MVSVLWTVPVMVVPGAAGGPTRSVLPGIGQTDYRTQCRAGGVRQRESGLAEQRSELLRIKVEITTTGPGRAVNR